MSSLSLLDSGGEARVPVQLEPDQPGSPARHYPGPAGCNRRCLPPGPRTPGAPHHIWQDSISAPRSLHQPPHITQAQKANEGRVADVGNGKPSSNDSHPVPFAVANRIFRSGGWEGSSLPVYTLLSRSKPSRRVAINTILVSHATFRPSTRRVRSIQADSLRGAHHSSSSSARFREGS